MSPVPRRVGAGVSKRTSTRSRKTPGAWCASFEEHVRQRASATARIAAWELWEGCPQVRIADTQPGARLVDKDGDPWLRTEAGATGSFVNGMVDWKVDDLPDADEEFGPFRQVG